MNVLLVSHGHPAETPGGAEVYAWDLYQAIKEEPGVRAYIITRAVRPPAFGPPVWADPHDPHHFRLFTEQTDFDVLFQEPRSPGRFVPWLERLVRTLAPDVVHVQHTQYIGLNLLRWVRAAAPRARLVYTLHEFVPLCHRQGLLLRPDGVRCDGPSPEKCHGCFPDVSPASWVFRTWHVRSRLDAVDVFVCPSRFLRDRYAAWGIPADKLVVEEYGRRPVSAVPPRPTDGLRDRFAYFGQVNPFKGVDVLLSAALRLAADGGPPVRLDVHGANLSAQHPGFQNRARELLDRATATGRVFDRGAYPQHEQSGRMAEADWVVVPSVWWENSPLVIQEAFAHGRPVICSDVGGMAEKVIDGVTGLHFRAGDPADLARVMRTAAGTPGLWERLRVNVRPPHPLGEHVRRVKELYR